jgi:thymidine kinase
VINEPQDILLQAKQMDVVAIDELHFFDPIILHVIEQLVIENKQVIVAGLDLDYRGNPFPAIAELLAKAEKVIKLTAICTKCGLEATRTQYLGNKEGLFQQSQAYPILLGDKDNYQARCRTHHTVPR